MAVGKRSDKRALQKVLGQGANVNAGNPLEVRDAKVGSLFSYEGVTTADGAADGSTLIDNVLTSKADFNGNLVIITSGAYAGQARDINGVTTAGTVTPHLVFGGQILNGTTFVIAAIRLTPAEVAALTTMVQTGQYYDRIFFDDATGIAGTAWPVGTPQVPSDVIADVITMCAARNLYTICVHGALTLGAAMQHYSFCGYEHEDVTDVLDLSGEDVDGSHIEGLIVTGGQGGAGFLTLVRCIANAITDFQGRMNFCSFWGGATTTFKDGGYIDLVDCESIYGAVTLTVQAPTRASIKNWRGNLVLTLQDGGVCHVRGFKGTLEIDEMTAGTLNVYANGADITINADCSGGTINIYGNARVTDNSGATVVNDYTKETQLDTIQAAVASMAGGAFFGSYGPRNVEVDNDVDFGIMLYDPSGNIITTGEITPGTYTVNRVRGAVDTEIVGSPPLASSEAAGRVYMTYAFPAASWAVGDIFYITFIGISVTIDGVTTDYPNLFIWGRVVREPDIASLIGTAADNADLGTLFARHLRQYLGTHTHALVVVHDTSALNADLDTALQQWLLDVGFVVTLADPTDVAGELEAGSFDLVMVSASCVAGDVGNLANLNRVGAPVICHSADIAASVVFDLGATPHTHAAQTEIEVTDNTVMFLITQALGDLVVTASANIYALNTITAASVELAQVDSHVDDHITALRLSAGEENEAGYAAFYDRYFVGVGDYTNMNAVWKAVMADLAMHCVMEKRFTEEAVVQVKGVYQEDVPDTDVTDTATTTEAECILLEIGPKNNRTYVLRHLRIKAQADPDPNTMTVKLYEYFEGALVNVDTFDIDTTNWGTYQSLMDMFGLQEIHSNAIRVACVMDAGTLEVKATYCYAEAKK